MEAAPNDAPIKVRVGFHVHLYLGIAVFVLSAIPFFSVIFLSGGFNASTDALVGAIAAVAVLHMALAFATRRCEAGEAPLVQPRVCPQARVVGPILAAALAIYAIRRLRLASRAASH